MTAQYPIDAKPKKKRRWVTPTIAIGTLVAAFAIGAGASGATTAEAPEPEVITEVETVTETVEAVPAVCLDAINSARAGFSTTVDVMDVVVPAIEAAFYRDAVGLEAVNADMEALNAEISSNNFASEAAACERAAR